QGIVEELAEKGGIDRFRSVTGLPLSTYFAATKILGLVENVLGLREQAEAGALLAAAMGTRVPWNLPGGPDAGVLASDVTNASRTLRLDLEPLAWREDIVGELGMPASRLPQVLPSSGTFGEAESSSLLRHTPIAGILGDQQAALFGQTAFDAGEAKNT